MFICKQMKLDSYLTPYTGIKYLNVWPETKKLLEETKGKSSLTWVLVMILFFFLNMPLNAQATKANQTSGIVSLGLQTPVESWSCYLYFWPTRCKSEVPKTPFLGSINLLEHLRNQRNILLARLPFYYKRIQFRNCDLEEMPRTNYGERVSHSPQISTC